MIQINDSSNKIKENKYKILRMSLLLGNGEDKEETINNFEDAARDIDAMNDQIYLKDLESKFYDTLTLEEEEKKLAVLVDYIGGRIEQRMSLLEDFNNVTGYELLNLPTIKYQERLEEYKNRLFYIREYLENSKNIDRLNKEIDNLENELNNSYVNKAKAEERNTKSEDELQERFNRIIEKKEELKEINKENAETKLIDIKNVADDSKKSLDIFNKSFATLNDAGISGEEKEEYSSYVKSAKEDYYYNKEIEYLVRLYIIINNKEKEYSQVLLKRDSINELINERIELRKELKVKGEDVLSTLYPALERQYNDIYKQKENIDNIELLISEIKDRKESVSNLEKDNQKVEILSLLKEFCIIDTYDETDNNYNIKDEEILKNNLEDDSINEDNFEFEENSSIKDITEENTENESLNNNNFNFEESSSTKDITEENDDKLADKINNNSINFDISEESNNSEVEDIPEEKTEENLQEENNSAKQQNNIDVEDNQVIDVSDANKINIEEAIAKSNNVMKRVGEMLGVKAEETSSKEEIHTNDSEQVQEDHEKKEPEISEKQEENISEINKEIPDNNEPANFEINENIFMSDNYDADPETNTTISNESQENQSSTENPLFNNSLANKTIDDVMADNKNIENDNNNDFWFSQEETPVDLNSLPDINPTPSANSEDNNSIFFGDSSNIATKLEFPNLEEQNTSSQKEA